MTKCKLKRTCVVKSIKQNNGFIEKNGVLLNIDMKSF